MPFFIPEYNSLMIHDMMLSDDIRVGAYQQAIEANVKPGDVVIDVGTGTGLLAMFAARAGARKVYAVEPTNTIELARRIIAQNGFSDRIELLHGRIEEVTLPEKADHIVSEWLGVFAVQENMLPCIAYARDHFLKPGGKLLPEKVDLFLALLEFEDLYQRRIERWRQFYGFDYREFAACQANDVHARCCSAENLLSAPAQVGELDMYVAQRSDLKLKQRLVAARPGTCHGVTGWFNLHFPGGITMDTAPDQPPTHWCQMYFPLLEPAQLEPGDAVEVKIIAQPDAVATSEVQFAWQISFPGSDKPAFAGDTRNASGSRQDWSF